MSLKGSFTTVLLALVLLGTLSAAPTSAFLHNTPFDSLGASELAARPPKCPPTSSRLIGHRYRTGTFFTGFCGWIDFRTIRCEWCECHYMAFVNGYHWTWTTGGDSGCSFELPFGVNF